MSLNKYQLVAVGGIEPPLQEYETCDLAISRYCHLLGYAGSTFYAKA